MITQDLEAEYAFSDRLRSELKASAATLFWLAAFTAGIFVASSTFNYKWVSLVTSWLIFSGLVYSIDLVNASLRYLSLAHVGLWATAAYGVLILQINAHWSFLEAAAASIGICIVLSFVIALFAFRTSGHYFALLTFVLSQVILLLFINNVGGWTGGSQGIFLFQHPSFFGWSTTPPRNFLEFTGVATVLIVAFIWLVRRSDFGQRCYAIGQSSQLAEAIGVATYRSRVMMFVVSAIPVAVSGILFGVFNGAISPDLFGADVAFSAVLVAILGGSGMLAGPLLGGAVYIFAPEVLPFEPTVSRGAVGLILIFVIRFSPGGIAHGVVQVARLVGRRTRGATA
jgi:branched-chain amino acid transport system permease protein